MADYLHEICVGIMKTKKVLTIKKRIDILNHIKIDFYSLKDTITNEKRNQKQRRYWQYIQLTMKVYPILILEYIKPIRKTK